MRSRIQSKGRPIAPDVRDKIILLLRETELTLEEIATRMGCSRTATTSINRKFQIRDYAGRRSQWTIRLF